MAKGGVVFQDADELKRRSEKECQEWIENPDIVEEAVLSQLGAALEKAKDSPKIRDVKEASYVLLFCKTVAEILGGDNIKVSYKIPKDFPGEAAYVNVVGKNIQLKDLSKILMFKSKIGAIEITDHTDGTISLCFSFFNTLRKI